MSLGSIFFLTQFTRFLFSTYYMTFNLLRFFFFFLTRIIPYLYLQVSLIQSKTECPLMAWPRPPRKIKPLFFTDYNHYIFFFCIHSSAFFFISRSIFSSYFFFKKYKLKVILPQSAYFKISLICLCTRQLARGFSPFPFKTLGNWSS